VTAVHARASETNKPLDGEPKSGIAPFLLGTAVGGVAGAIAGVLLGNATRSLLLGLFQICGRRVSDAEREELRFELLLQ